MTSYRPALSHSCSKSTGWHHFLTGKAATQTTPNVRPSHRRNQLPEHHTFIFHVFSEQHKRNIQDARLRTIQTRIIERWLGTFMKRYSGDRSMKDHTSYYHLPTTVPNSLTNPTVSLQGKPPHGFPILQPRTERSDVQILQWLTLGSTPDFKGVLFQTHWKTTR